MATAAGQKEVTLLATYCGKRLSLTVPTKVKVADVVQKAAETLNLKSEDLPLSLLYQGSPIDDTAPLDVSLSPFLQPASLARRCVELRVAFARRVAGDPR